MKNPANHLSAQHGRISKGVVFLLLLILVPACLWGYEQFVVGPKPAPVSPVAVAHRAGLNKVKLAPEQVNELDVGPVESRTFALTRDAIGYIDFNQERTTQVFSPYQGRIGQIPVHAGEDVAQGQVLFTVLIPDLPQAAASLIAAAGSLNLTSETLRRAQKLIETQSIPLKELQQNIAEQQAADANYRAARKSLSLFGLSDQDIEAIESNRKIDTEMSVRSPYAGRVTVRAAAAGLLVQPGGAAPVTVSDISRLWMIASIPEAELASFHVNQAVRVTVAAYPDQVFTGAVNYIGDSVDPNTHRITVRADIADPRHLLKPQMFAKFTASIGVPMRSIAVPQEAVAREGDGSLSVWVTVDGTVFERRTVTTGIVQDNRVQILTGLSAGEKVARHRGLFLSNLYTITIE